MHLCCLLQRKSQAPWKRCMKNYLCSLCSLQHPELKIFSNSFTNQKQVASFLGRFQWERFVRCPIPHPGLRDFPAGKICTEICDIFVKKHSAGPIPQRNSGYQWFSSEQCIKRTSAGIWSRWNWQTSRRASRIWLNRASRTNLGECSRNMNILIPNSDYFPLFKDKDNYWMMWLFNEQLFWPLIIYFEMWSYFIYFY